MRKKRKKWSERTKQLIEETYGHEIAEDVTVLDPRLTSFIRTNQIPEVDYEITPNKKRHIRVQISNLKRKL